MVDEDWLGLSSWWISKGKGVFFLNFVFASWEEGIYGYEFGIGDDEWEIEELEFRFCNARKFVGKNNRWTSGVVGS